MKVRKLTNTLSVITVLFCAVAISCSKDNEPNLDNENKEVFDFAWVERDSIWTTYPDSSILVLDVDSNRQILTKGTFLSFSGEDNHAELTLLAGNSNISFWLDCTFNTMVADTFNIWYLSYRNSEYGIDLSRDTYNKNLTASWKTRKFQIIRTEDSDDSLSVEAMFHIKLTPPHSSAKDIKGTFRYNGIKRNGVIGGL